jgi:hypothetical protein
MENIYIVLQGNQDYAMAPIRKHTKPLQTLRVATKEFILSLSSGFTLQLRRSESTEKLISQEPRTKPRG